jgi:5-methyltetrahydropteroyltriglutamate--homocysteine methyltransferase
VTDLRAPFRADHVGSLLRPAELREARERYIRAAARMQEEIGLQSITDGEFRRTSFHFDFLGKLAGVEAKLAMPARTEEAAAQPKVFRPPQLAITGKLAHTAPIERDGFLFLKSVTSRTPKTTMPSPTMCLRGGRAAVSRDVYPDLEAYYADVAKAYGAEIRALADAGCTYVQFDDTNFAYLCDASMRADMAARGEDPDETLDRYIRVFNSVLAQKPAGMTFVTHICRGNLHSRWARTCSAASSNRWWRSRRRPGGLRPDVTRRGAQASRFTARQPMSRRQKPPGQSMRSSAA